MSSDNGIYVIQTFGPEFRVAYGQAIDQIFGKFDNETLRWTGDVKMIQEYFRDSEIYADLESALDKAEEMSYDHEYLEDGICVITDFKEIKFNEE